MRERVIEYVLEDRMKKEKQLVDMTLSEFTNETASESPAPGGGSISAYVAALGVSLGTMVANLSSHKRGWDDKWEYYSDWAVKGQGYKNELMRLVDEDTNAFTLIMDAFGLPKGTDEEKATRKNAILEATKGAIQVPLSVMRVSFESMEVMLEMAKTGLPASISDAGVGALCARAAIRGAHLNVKINAAGIEDNDYNESIFKESNEIEEKAHELENTILELVYSKI